MASGGGGESKRARTAPLDLADLARKAQTKEVTSATFSYVDAMLTGKLSDADFRRVRDEILGDAASAQTTPPIAGPPRGGGAAADAEAIERLEERMAAGDFCAALQVAESILTRSPDHDIAVAYAVQCRAVLAAAYQAYLGHGGNVPRLAVASDRLGAFAVDEWAAHLLTHVDGARTIVTVRGWTS